MATPISSPNILWQIDMRRFEYTFQWADGKFTGEAMLVLNNNRVLSQLPKTGYHHKILDYLERTEFKGFARNHSEWQRRLFKSSGGENGFLFIRFFPVRIQITAEPEAVVWKDDSAGGSAIDAMKTPHPFDQSSEEPSASIIQSVGSLGKHGRFCPQGTQHTNQTPTTAEFRYAPKEVVQNDDSPDGSTTDPTNPRETPESNIEPSSESPQMSIPCSLTSSEEVIHRVQPTLSEQTALSSPPRSPQVPTTSTSVVPRKRKREICSWSAEEDELLTNMLMGVKTFCLEKFQGRTTRAIHCRFNATRKTLIALGHKPIRWRGSSADQRRQTFITIARVFQEEDSEEEVIKGVIEALPEVSEEAIRNEYRHLNKSGKDLDGKVKAWLEENRQDRWRDVRHRFPGLGVSQFERVCRRLREGGTTQILSKILW